MKTKWKLALGLIFIVVVAVVLIYEYFIGVEVDAYRVERGDLVESITEEGLLVSEDQRTVYSLYQARIEAVAVEEGEQVERGDLLVVLDASELEYTLTELRSGLESVNSEISMVRDNLNTAARNYERIKALYDRDWATRIELEEAEKMKKEARSALESLEAQHNSLTAQIQTIEYRLENHRINAPISGVVTDLNAEEQGLAGPQVPLMRLFQKDEVAGWHFEVEARVLTRDVEFISVGEEVTLIFQRREEDLKFPGEITRIAEYAEGDISPLGLEEERITVTIRPDLPDQVTLGPGYKVDVEFITRVTENVLVVPRRALFTYEGEDALMVVIDDRARVRKVTTGMETRQEVEILDGIGEGNPVILDPQQEGIEDGARVFY